VQSDLVFDLIEAVVGGLSGVFGVLMQRLYADSLVTGGVDRYFCTCCLVNFVLLSVYRVV
jgi:hypothetical protein